MSKKKRNKKAKEKKQNQGMSIKEYFESRTGYLMTDYIAQHFINSINKYGEDLFEQGLKTTLNKNDIMPFRTQVDFIKYLYGVLRNLNTVEDWVKVK
ncbi:hypothetical protein LDJ90_02630 [Fusobacterium vincentii]|jgi:hypothetical protein|uniref:Uncharacterized protein n=1 Tax=Fusobacterium nucleatum TaxID=851 RepID=A0A133P0S2_FUSNU|nr:MULTISPECIES: hypothetical protein [Fusobacterium]DAI43580.1 MAG TPA: hypothetical protein [Caudoviricetes sp.]ATV06033.1 hypothetical protein CS401_04140 [Fusobacterium vincentii]KXA22132.1 hypothetical protein HMPREF3221_01012 [Fusobacterium nucleatum]MCL4592959.1 hypothetical protein [Fusobacterium nucleatum YWH7053]VTX56992.1 Uncharacterised protein [Fusobacterium nucleatum]